MPNICLDCIGDGALKDLIGTRATQVECSYCEQSGLGLSIEELAEVVDEPLRVYLRIGGYEPTFSSESDSPDWEQEGESLDWILQEELEIDSAPAEALATALQDGDHYNPGDGEEPFYCGDESYCRSYISSGAYDQTWEGFSLRIRHGRRFFDEVGRALLEEILGASGSERARELPAMEIGPETAVQWVFRARLADAAEQLQRIQEHPSRELGPPPPDKATPGRMNPAGISVFYGALSQETAIAEVRPFVGSRVVVGRFEVTRRLRLLSFPMLGGGYSGSIFHPDYEDRASRLQFLGRFHATIAHPVLPSDELLEYIPTQAVAEYICNVLHFDGILYASSQVGAGPDEFDPSPPVRNRTLTETELAQSNLVLFGGAAVVSQGEAQAPQSEGPPQVDTEGALRFESGSNEVFRVGGVHYRYLPDCCPSPDLDPDEEARF